MKCNFQNISEGVLKCTQCDFVLKTNQHPDKAYRNCRKEGERPGIIEQAKQVVKEYTVHIVNGAEYVTEEEKHSRLDICGQCEHFEAAQCKLCTCFMNAKAELKTAKCPIGKW